MVQKRCPKCERSYSQGKQKYNTPLTRCYVKIDVGEVKSKSGKSYRRKELHTIPYFYCPDCKCVWKEDDSRIGGN